MLKPSLLLVLVVSLIGVALSADTLLWRSCSTQYCAEIWETPPCGLSVKVFFGSLQVLNQPFDLAVSNQVCATFGCEYCIKLQNLTKSAVDGQIHPCVYLTTCGTPQFLGCITSSNNLAQCLSQGCPSGCSGHGECMSSGACDCDSGYFGDDCSQLQPLFDQCIQVPNYGTLCTKLEYESCAINAEVYGSLTGVPVNVTLYETTIEAPQFNTYFGSAQCFSSAGCTGCIYFDDFILTETYAKGCPTVNFSCPTLPAIAPLTYQCFEDDALVPACFGRCPMNCSDRGVCTNGACDCTGTGYKGSVCGIPDCSEVFDCYGHGECIGYNKCQCDDGYFGDLCQGAKCDAVNQCSYHGSCNTPNVCTCNTGYNGTTCSDLLCTTPCKNSGVCVQGVCKCTDEWQGDDCTTKKTTNPKTDSGGRVYVIFGVVIGIIVSVAIGAGAFFAYRWRRSQRTGAGFSTFDDGLIQVPDREDE